MNPMLILGLVVTLTTVAQAAPRTLAFYTVQPTSTPPQLDGRLDDACWQNAPVASTYFVYWKPDPGPGELQTDMRMVYDDRGVYLAITNHEERIQDIRATKTTRDVADLWTDDCAEFYFDPAALGIGFTRFVVNSLGTQQDDRRVDAAVALKNWSGPGWRVATQVMEDRWTIEVFFPWGDLGRRAQPGDLWMFNHVRYGYSSGEFKGVTWSPGGNYHSPQNFGYLLFTDEGSLALTSTSEEEVDAVAAQLGEAVTPPWQLALGEGLLVCSQRGKVRWLTPEQFLQDLREELEQSLAAADAHIAKAEHRQTLATLHEHASSLAGEPPSPTAALDAARRLTQLHEQAEELTWQARLNRLLEELEDAEAVGSAPE